MTTNYFKICGGGLQEFVFFDQLDKESIRAAHDRAVQIAKDINRASLSCWYPAMGVRQIGGESWLT